MAVVYICSKCLVEMQPVKNSINVTYHRLDDAPTNIFRADLWGCPICHHRFAKTAEDPMILPDGLPANLRTGFDMEGVNDCGIWPNTDPPTS